MSIGAFAINSPLKPQQLSPVAGVLPLRAKHHANKAAGGIPDGIASSSDTV